MLGQFGPVLKSENVPWSNITAKFVRLTDSNRLRYEACSSLEGMPLFVVEIELVKGKEFRILHFEKTNDAPSESSVAKISVYFLAEHLFAEDADKFASAEYWDGKVPGASLVYPIAVFSNMITAGIGISNTRIAMLHLNGAITDLVSFDFSQSSRVHPFS